MEEKKVTLILVDFQEDFISENGSLYVRGSSSALWQTLKFLESGKVERVIFTLDWHPIDHCSFKENGGEWPIHCVQYTQGAMLSKLLLEYCYCNHIPVMFLHKGIYKDEEEYGAFQDSHLIADSFLYYDCWTTSDSWIPYENIYIAGIAGDYCVLETIKNLTPIWDKLTIFLPGVASIDGGKKLTEFINQNQLKSIS